MSTTARRATIAILALHGILFVIALPDYFVSIDSGYHVSLARWYGEHGSAWWDHINFGPGGRPNLQGPLMHMAIGYLGRVLGGDGMDYVRATQTAAAIGQGIALLFGLIGLFTNLFFFGRLSTAMASPAGHHLGAWVILVPVAAGIGDQIAAGNRRIIVT